MGAQAQPAPVHQVALDGRAKGDDTSLASSTLLADENNRDIFGLVVSYAVKVRPLKATLHCSCSLQTIKSSTFLLFVIYFPSCRRRTPRALRQVRLFLGAIGGEVTAELPFVLMHPKVWQGKVWHGRARCGCGIL